MSETTPLLDRIVQAGNYTGENWISCADGFKVSVLAHWGAYCTPRPGFGEVSRSYTGPFTAVEVGYPSERPEPWVEWAKHCEDAEDPTETVYGYVPVELVRALIEAHGGETP